MTNKKKKNKKRKNTKKNNLYKKLLIFVSIVFILASPLLFFFIYFNARVYPNIYIAGINVSGKTKSQIISLLSNKPKNETLFVALDNQSIQIPSGTIDYSYDISKTTERALQLGRSGNLFFDIDQIFKAVTKKINYPIDINISTNKLDDFIQTLSNEYSTDPSPIQYQLQGTALTLTNIGKPGREIDTKNFQSDLIKTISFENTNTVKISFIPTPQSEMIDSLVSQLSTKLNITPKNAQFSFVNGSVQSFSPEINGVKVDEETLRNEITNKISSLQDKNVTIQIPVIKTNAQVKASDVNNLGINELIGSGTSHFAGSDSSRIFNINLAASRINNSLIAPGQTFSFDQTVGDISEKTGYKQAYIIQNGQTILGDGGGVCQVSTTLFRAVMNSGLPVIARTAHAYRVHYYEQDSSPGFDATVYSPNVDFKFRNDTANYVLIQTQIDLRHLILTFNFYGTKDGRQISITKPTLWGYEPAPQVLYTDDPNLPIGTVKQVDFAASGIKSQFEYTVTKDGQTINHQVFYSNFKPWQAKFLKGTKV